MSACVFPHVCLSVSVTEGGVCLCDSVSENAFIFSPFNIRKYWLLQSENLLSHTFAGIHFLNRLPRNELPFSHVFIYLLAALGLSYGIWTSLYLWRVGHKYCTGLVVAVCAWGLVAP